MAMIISLATVCNESWDNNAGGDAALQDRTSRHDSASGKATLNINKKKLVVDIANQVVADGKQPNLKPGKDTINNYDDLINIGLVKGDKFDESQFEPDTASWWHYRGSIT